MRPAFNTRSAAARAAVTLTAMAALIAASGCKKSDSAADAEPAPVAVQAQHPTVGPISAEITADAVLTPLAQAAIAPRISAPIRAEYVQRGARVHAGQLLVTLEDRDLVGNAQDLKGGYTSAKAAYATATQATIPAEVQKAKLDLDQAAANLVVAKRTADERKVLLQQGAIAGRDVDIAVAAEVQAQAAYDAAAKNLQAVQSTTEKASIASAQGQLTSAQGRLTAAEAQVSYANLRSPINGVVTDRPLFPGETASAGTPVITVMDTSSLIAKLHIAQSSAQKLSVGDAAEVEVPGDKEPQHATVSLISPALDPGSTTVEVWLKLPNPQGQFKVGTAVHTVLRGDTIQNAVQVPPGAIVPAEDGSTSVLLIAPDGTAKKRGVVVGIRTPESVQIVSGITASDMVITSGGYGLDNGTKVKIGAADDDDAAGGDKADAADAKGDKDDASAKGAGTNAASADKSQGANTSTRSTPGAKQ